MGEAKRRKSLDLDYGKPHLALLEKRSLVAQQISEYALQCIEPGLIWIEFLYCEAKIKTKRRQRELDEVELSFEPQSELLNGLQDFRKECQDCEIDGIEHDNDASVWEEPLALIAECNFATHRVLQVVDNPPVMLPLLEIRTEFEKMLEQEKYLYQAR